MNVWRRTYRTKDGQIRQARNYTVRFAVAGQTFQEATPYVDKASAEAYRAQRVKAIKRIDGESDELLKAVRLIEIYLTTRNLTRRLHYRSREVSVRDKRLYGAEAVKLRRMRKALLHFKAYQKRRAGGSVYSMLSPHQVYRVTIDDASKEGTA